MFELNFVVRSGHTGISPVAIATPEVPETIMYVKLRNYGSKFEKESTTFWTRRIAEHEASGAKLCWAKPDPCPCSLLCLHHITTWVFVQGRGKASIKSVFYFLCPDCNMNIDGE